MTSLSMIWKYLIAIAALIYSLAFMYEQYRMTVEYNESIYRFCLEKTDFRDEAMNRCKEAFKDYYLPF